MYESHIETLKEGKEHVCLFVGNGSSEIIILMGLNLCILNLGLKDMSAYRQGNDTHTV